MATPDRPRAAGCGANCQVITIIDELAAVACMSKQHFMRSFKQQTGYTVHAQVTMKRIKAAKNLLLSNAFSASEFGRQVGYQSDKGFASAFLKPVGISPSKFRIKESNQRKWLRSDPILYRFFEGMRVIGFDEDTNQIRSYRKNCLSVSDRKMENLEYLQNLIKQKKPSRNYGKLNCSSVRRGHGLTQFDSDALPGKSTIDSANDAAVYPLKRRRFYRKLLFRPFFYRPTWGRFTAVHPCRK